MAAARLLMISGLIAIFAFCPNGFAQAPSVFAIEGYITNSKNDKPLKDVDVIYRATLIDNTEYAASGRSGPDGFYQLEGFPPSQQVTAVSVYAICHSRRRGDLRFDTFFYSEVRTKVYRRDFRIALPRNVSDCDVN